VEFKIREQNGKKAVFRDGKQISEWFDEIWDDGLVSGQSNYFIAKEDGKQAIYEYKDGKIVKITDDFDLIWHYGLVLGQSNYFIGSKNSKDAIYEYKDGEVIKISDDFDWIYGDGLVDGQSNYFRADGKFLIYHKLLDKKIGYISKFEDYKQNKELTKLPLLVDEC